MADYDPFSNVEAYYAKAQFYKVKAKGKADDEDVSVVILIRHPLVGFTQPVTH